LKNLARKSALSTLAQDNKVALVEGFVLDTPKTKAFNSIMANLRMGGKKTLVVTPSFNENLVLSSRNVSKVKVTTVSGLNTYDLLNADNLVLVEETINTLQELYSTK
jgi:large subunit ribosomal protein L4